MADWRRGQRDEIAASLLRINRAWVLRLAVAGLTIELVIALSTLLPGAPVFPQWPQFVLFPVIFFVHIRTVGVFMQQRRWNTTQFLRMLQPRIAAAFVAVFVSCWAFGLLSIIHLRGQPEGDNGRYFLNDHGSHIPVSHAGYEHALVLQQRIFTLIPAMFFAFAVLASADPPWGVNGLVRRDDSPPVT